MSEEEKIDPQHGGVRQVLRVVGPLTAGAGLLFLIVGLGSFFSSFGTFEPPRYFWCCFVGLPLLALGIAMCKFAFLGAVLRYTAGEVAPVGKDTFNYMADGTAGGVKQLASAIGSGLSEGMGGGGTTVVRCHKCNHPNDPDAKFCDQCGAALLKSQPCPTCRELNDPDAKFCDNCGARLTAGLG